MFSCRAAVSSVLQHTDHGTAGLQPPVCLSYSKHINPLENSELRTCTERMDCRALSPNCIFSVQPVCLLRAYMFCSRGAADLSCLPEVCVLNRKSGLEHILSQQKTTGISVQVSGSVTSSLMYQPHKDVIFQSFL